MAHDAQSGAPSKEPTAMHADSSNNPTAEELQHYLPLVRQIVARFLRRLPPNVLRDDLIAAGTYGLLDSLRKSKETRGPTFEWYARVRIRGAIVDELRSQDWLSRRARSRATQADPPSASGHHAVVGFDDLPERTRAGLADDDVRSPLELLLDAREHSSLARAVSSLAERERMIVTLHYFQGVQFKRIAAALGVSEPRVSQLHSRAMLQLRSLLAANAAREAA